MPRRLWNRDRPVPAAAAAAHAIISGALLHTEIIHRTESTVHPNTLRPRGPQVVVEQHWRQDEDGTFIVLMHSVRHHRARQVPAPWYSWMHPVRAKVRPLLILSTKFGSFTACMLAYLP